MNKVLVILQRPHLLSGDIWSGRPPAILHSELLQEAADFGALGHRDGLLDQVTSDPAAQGPLKLTQVATFELGEDWLYRGLYLS